MNVRPVVNWMAVMMGVGNAARLLSQPEKMFMAGAE